MKKISLVAICILSFHCLNAQFITAGKIEFERRTNQHSFLEEGDMFDDLIKESLPKFAVTYYDLVFDENKSLFKEGKEPENKKIHWSINYMSNIVFKDLANDYRISQKSLFGSEYLIRDSMFKIDWKVTNEPRTIAGFECRKAVAKIFDSVIVIAFYTDEIIPASGPESFGGLPGMILGLAIPRLHTTWYATKLQVLDSKVQLTPPTGGKKYEPEDFKKQLADLLKRNEWLKKIAWQVGM
jgi:GLPGLI family protein